MSITLTQVRKTDTIFVCRIDDDQDIFDLKNVPCTEVAYLGYPKFEEGSDGEVIIETGNCSPNQRILVRVRNYRIAGNDYIRPFECETEDGGTVTVWR